MKNLYKALFYSAVLFLLLSNKVSAQYMIGNKQVDTSFNSRVNFLFAHLEKNRIPYGLLRDYAFEFTNLENYNGTYLADSNMVDKGIFFGIYNTLVTSGMTTAAVASLPDPALVDSLWFRSRQPGRISLCGLFYQYARFSNDAYTSGKITSSNEQVYDVYNGGVWQNPYTTERTQAFAPSIDSYTGLNFNLHFTDSLWLSNSKNTVDHIEVDLSNGNGYQRLTPGTDLPVNYPDSGLKVWNFKIFLTDQTVLQSHTRIKVNIDPYDPGGDTNSIPLASVNGSKTNGGQTNTVTPVGGQRYKVISNETYNGVAAKGIFTIRYASGHTNLQNPLIVVEGYDPGIYTSPEDYRGKYYIRDFLEEVNHSPALSNLVNSTYDIVFIDYQNGVDDIHRNALLVKDVIRWVNSNKTTTNPNVVIGLSMGGLVARYALKKMEQNNEQTQVRLYVSHDSPQGGVNVPLGYQYLLHHANNLYFRSGAVPATYFVVRLYNPSLPNIGGLLALTEAPASKQMLINHINPYMNLDNSVHNAWQSELTSLGYPTQCRNLAISNGSECGLGQSILLPGGQLFNANGYYQTNFLQSLAGMVLGPVIGVLIGQGPLILGVLPGRNKISLAFQVNAGANGGGNQVYSGNISYQKKFLWLVNINATLTSLAKSAFSGALPYDSYGSGIYNTIGTVSINTPNLTANTNAGFCFVPTPSALDISGSPTNLTASDYQAAYYGDNPPAGPKNSTFSNFVTAFYADPDPSKIYPKGGNEPHITYETRNGNWLTAELNASGGNYPAYGCETFCANTAISGSSNICASSGTTPYSVPVFNSNASYNWTTSSNLQIASGQGTNTANIQGTGSNGSGTITLTISNNQCGNYVITKTITIGGQPIVTSIAASQSGPCQSGYQTWYLQAIPGSSSATGWQWTVDNPSSGYYNIQSPNSPTTYVTVSGGGGVSVTYVDQCGVRSTRRGVTIYSNCSSRIASYPNPADKEMNIQYQADNTAQTSAANQSFGADAGSEKLAVKSYDVILYNDKGKILRSAKSTKGEAVKLNTVEIPNGNYFLHIIEGKEVTKKQVIIQH